MEKPGVESEKAKDGTDVSQTPVPEKQRKFPWGKALAATAAAGVIAATLYQCSGEGQNTAPSAPTSSIDPDGRYFVVLEDGPVRDQPRGNYISGLFAQKGSCVQGTSDAQGQQVRAGRTIQVKATEQNGAERNVYIHMGNVRQVPAEEVPPTGCKAVFVQEAALPPAPQRPPEPTYTTNQTVNLRDDWTREAPVWGTLPPNACVVATGDENDGMMQVGLVTTQSAPQVMSFKWVPKQQMIPSDRAAATCISNHTEGGRPAGVTPRP